MSFLTEAAIRQMATTTRVVSTQAPRRFSTSIIARKTVTESAKDTLKSVDRKVSDKIVDGINVGAKAAEAISGKANPANPKATGNAEEIRQKMKAEAEELAGKAKHVAKETADTVKGAAKQGEEEIKESV
ncbi:hypothetical protein GGR50DRAFT_526027 [Xylaria sp. CBS 124048]|nr:hypothetical protein GGR50DRAFT_526027 [Xylaria sp. CBS 124048]